MKLRQWENADLIRDCNCHSECIPMRLESCKTAHHEGCEHDPNVEVVQWSEQTIARERQLRRIKRETAKRQAVQSLPVEPTSESTFAGLGFHVREASPIGNGWRCPSKGACSDSGLVFKVRQ